MIQHLIVKILLVLMEQVLHMKNVKNIKIHVHLLNQRQLVKIYKIVLFINQQKPANKVHHMNVYGILKLKHVLIKLVLLHQMII